jgi:hypothetical protein
VGGGEIRALPKACETFAKLHRMEGGGHPQSNPAACTAKPTVELIGWIFPGENAMTTLLQNFQIRVLKNSEIFWWSFWGLVQNLKSEISLEVSMVGLFRESSSGHQSNWWKRCEFVLNWL